jgi:hypothetical protein
VTEKISSARITELIAWLESTKFATKRLTDLAGDTVDCLLELKTLRGRDEKP